MNAASSTPASTSTAGFDLRPVECREAQHQPARRRRVEGAAKIAASLPRATAADETWPVWTGIVPVSLRATLPIPAPDAMELPVPALPHWLA